MTATCGDLAVQARRAAALLDAQRGPDCLTCLRDALSSLLTFRNFIVFDYAAGRAPVLLASSFDRVYLLRHMNDYLLGLYQLDPFYALADGNTGGLFRMRDIAPEGFQQSEYYLRHYQLTQVIDELRYVVPIAAGRSIHLFIEREFPSPMYTDGELQCLHDINPFVSALVRGHIDWLDGNSVKQPSANAGFKLREAILTIAPGEITARECDIIELMLKGHSVKSMSTQLSIEEVTVTNHKRNIYAKLGVHSQAQLFDRFLRALAL